MQEQAAEHGAGGEDGGRPPEGGDVAVYGCVRHDGVRGRLAGDEAGGRGGGELPDGMKRAMARQAEAEREKRAKIIAAEGEALAAGELASASDVMLAHPLALQPVSYTHLTLPTTPYV